MAALNGAENLSERADYSISHRTPPAVPSAPTFTQLERTEGEVNKWGSKQTRQRGGSFGQLFRLNSSSAKVQSTPIISNPQVVTTGHGQLSSVPIATAPRAPPTQQAPAFTATAPPSSPPPNSPETGRKNSLSTTRKISLEGRSMLRKGSRKAREEAERQEQERRARRMNAPAPTLELLHEPLPGIETFGGDNIPVSAPSATASASASPPKPTNFSRPNVAMSSSTAANSSSPASAVRSGQASSSPIDSTGRSNGEYVANSVSRTESVTNRGRYSYTNSIIGGNMSSPRRVRRRKDPTPFNILVIGAKNSGKTSFISLLRHSLAPPPGAHTSSEPDSTVHGNKSLFTSNYLETDLDGERVGVTLWDSAGLERNIVDLQLREITAFVESKFEETFAEEQKVVRSPGIKIKDTHIHCVFLVLDPTRLDATVAASAAQQTNGVGLSSVSGLDDSLDLQVLRVLWGKTTVIPVIAKGDTLTISHMAFLKRAVWSSIKAARLDPLEALELEDDPVEEDDDIDEEDESANGHDSNEDSDQPPTKNNHKRQSSTTLGTKPNDDETPYIPMSILSPDPYDMPPYTRSPSDPNKVGRRFAWGFADPYNPAHCDFPRLRDSVFSEWRSDLRDLSRVRWYENWRTSRLNSNNPTHNLPYVGSGGKQQQQQRIKGGVTPVAAVPREGLSSPGTVREFSGGSTAPAGSTGF